jgi:hypothetical protein
MTLASRRWVFDMDGTWPFTTSGDEARPGSTQPRTFSVIWLRCEDVPPLNTPGYWRMSANWRWRLTLAPVRLRWYALRERGCHLGILTRNAMNFAVDLAPIGWMTALPSCHR